MAANKPEIGESTPIEISELKEIRNTPESVFRGICAAEGWRPGKSVTEEDYDGAVQRFLRRPVGKAGS